MTPTVFVGALAATCAIAGVGGYEVSIHSKAAPPVIPVTTPLGVPMDWNQYLNIVTGKTIDTACYPTTVDLLLPCDTGGK